MISVLVMPTARCDRGCSHCEFDSGTLGESISPSLLSTLPREFGRLGPGEKHFCITGGGEPLLYPWTPKLIWGVLQDRRNWVDLVTSGCVDEDDTGYRSLEIITDAFRSARFRTYLSYNAFMPKADERLRFTLPLLRKINGLVAIKVAMSYLDRSPMERLQSLLEEMGYGNRIIMPERALSRRVMERITEEKYLSEFADFSHTVYFRENDFTDDGSLNDGFCSYEKHLVSVKAQTLLIEGRADKLAPSIEDLMQHTSPRKRCNYLRGGCSQFLRIDYTGAIYPCALETPKPNPLLRIGMLGEIPLWEAMSRREEVLERARERVFLSPTGFHSNPCGYCCDDRTGRT